MYSLDEEKIECVLGNRDILLLAGQESRECCIFISDVAGFAVFICLWRLVLPNSNNLINHVLYI